jgi:hypothetical protein
MSVVALALTIVWIFSLWLLLVEQSRPRTVLLSGSVAYLGIMSGAILLLILSLTSLVFLRLVIAD